MVTNAYSVIKQSTIFALLGLLSACSLQAHEQKPALLLADSKQARAEIINLVSQSLAKKNIAIAEDVFQHSSRLLLGKKAVTSPEGVKIYRADKAPALVFELVKYNGNCLLRRIDTEQAWQLTTKRCVIR
jgi:hypothetical protein